MLNFTPPDFQILVGNLDVTNALTSLSIKHNNWSIGKPLYWSGSIDLVVLDPPFALTESLDDWLNPTRWARGQIVKLFVKNILICTLRIASYAYDEDDRKATIEVSQLLDLLDYDSVPKDYEGLGFKSDRSISLIELVSKLIKEAGIVNFAWNISGVFNRDFVPPNHTGGSFIALASKYLNERLIWLYHDADETVKLVRYPNSNFTGLISFTRARNELEDYRRSPSRELPCNVVCVTGGGEKFHECEKDNEEQEELGYGTDLFIVTGVAGATPQSNQVLTYKKLTKPIESLSYQPDFIGTEIKVYKARSGIIPNGEVPSWVGNLTQLILTDKTINKKYFDAQGRLVKETSNTDSIKATMFSNMVEFYDDETVVKNAYKTEITYLEELPRQNVLQGVGSGKTNNNKGIIKQKRQVTYTPFLSGTVEPLANDFNILNGRVPNKNKPQIKIDISEIIEETWTEQDKDKKCPFFKYQKKVFKRKQVKQLIKNYLNSGKNYIIYSLGGLNEDTASNATSENATPPNWELKPPENPTESVNLNVERNFPTLGIDWQNATEENQRRLEYQCATLLTEQEANTLADFLGRSQLQSYYAREISLPLADCDEFLSNPQPFNRAYLHQGAYILSAESINISNNEAELAFIGLFERPLSFPMIDRPSQALPSPPSMPIEVIGFPVKIVRNLPVQIILTEAQSKYGQTQLPNFDQIVVIDGDVAVTNGNVVVSGGYPFTEIVTSGDRLVWHQNNLVTQDSPFSEDYWNRILSMDGEEVTMNGKVLIS